MNDPRLAAVIVQAWMNSPHHRANILRPDFTHLGVGVIIQNDEARATQNFSEIKSYLKIPLPQSLPSGSPVAFATSQPAAQMFDLQPVGKTAAQSRPAPIENARLTAPPDTYRIRFFFPETKKGAFAIYDGPQIIVR